MGILGPVLGGTKEMAKNGVDSLTALRNQMDEASKKGNHQLRLWCAARLTEEERLRTRVAEQCGYSAAEPSTAK